MVQIGQQSEKRDVSKQTLIVLVVLAIVVSLLGTFTVVRETSGVHKVMNVNEESTVATQTSQGKVSLTIVDSNGDSSAPENRATGQVTFEIIK
jgi:hypothetical protein